MTGLHRQIRGTHSAGLPRHNQMAVLCALRGCGTTGKAFLALEMSLNATHLLLPAQVVLMASSC